MTKTAGMGDNCYVGGYDLSGDVGSLSRIGGGPTPLDVTGINASAHERLGGVRDGGIEFQSWFNPAAAQEHAVLSTLPTTDRLVTYCRSTTAGKPAASVLGKQVNYDPSRGADGSLGLAVQTLGNHYGLEWGVQLTAGKRTDTGATAGASVDLGTASPGLFGAQFYLHVFSFVGTDATITVHESSDDAIGDPFAAVVGGAFTTVTTAPLAQRIATAAIAVERYLKVVTTTSAGFTSLVFSVMAVRNDTLTAF